MALSVAKGAPSGKFKFKTTSTGSTVLCLEEEAWPEAAPAVASPVSPAAAAGGAGEPPKGREKQRLTASSGHRHAVGETVKIGGAFSKARNPSYLADRASVYDRVIAAQTSKLAALPHVPITITLPDGKVKEGIAFETTPLKIAESISKSLAGAVVVAKVLYSTRVGSLGSAVVNTGPAEGEEDDEAAPAKPLAVAELWDLTRPLEGDCLLELKTFEDPEGKMVFWHSSAHVLGECLECEYGVKLCIGPPTQEGFYYDAYMGAEALNDKDYPTIKAKAEAVCGEKQKFERIVLTKEEALELFADNPFKVSIISTKIPDGGSTTAYRCGPLIDLCMGPHVPDTGRIKAFEILNHSAAYWLGQQTNDTLQRVYGVSFPDKKLMKQHLERLEEAKKRDHRVLADKYDLFFFHTLSPGSAFFLPAGAFVYNKLIAHIRSEYMKRGYTEVVTPNMFNLDLWRISGHYDHYLENMFTFDVEGQGFGLKPMNCPGHCLMFAHRIRSHRDLPIRLADFGVLHRNEFSGALTGLTRVRRFQQDDAHIFCRVDQIRNEVAGVLDFMNSCYTIFGFTYELNLSTRPKKALGSRELWDQAEGMMKDALEEFGKPWKINPGDGAFYGPKIDIKVFDALGRPHQCATIQLDFQLPIRFKLRYKSSGKQEKEGEGEEEEEEEKAPAAAAHDHAPSAETATVVTELPAGFERPVIIHRAILGSVERMIAVLLEHTAGKWPFWLSPRQLCIVPVSMDNIPYCQQVYAQLKAAGFEVTLEASTKTMNKKIREAQLAQYNFILVAGNDEQTSNSVNVRSRDNTRVGTKTIAEAIEWFTSLVDSHQ